MTRTNWSAGVLAVVLTTVLTSILTFLAPTSAVADPVTADPIQGAHITGIENVTDRWVKISVYSPAMNKVVVNDVFKATKPGAPVFYLLPGIDGGDDLVGGLPPGTKSWFGMTDIQGFFADKNVNVVSPLGGAFSWYTDWIGDSSKQYQTYMTKELPPLLNKELNASGRNAVGGLSSTGGTALDYAIQVPGLYQAVGSYSGFLTTSDPTSSGQISLTLSSGGASAEAMWGPQGGPLWVAHDPSQNVAKLAGTAVWVGASASGEVGEVDNLPPDFGPNITGGFIERIVAESTRVFADNAAAAGIPVTYVVRPNGSHTWGLFGSEMQESWTTTIGPALGVA